MSDILTSSVVKLPLPLLARPFGLAFVDGGSTF